jgi:cation diffusion facilitator family transporter
MKSRQQKIIRASWVSITGNTILSVMKISVGLAAGSLAVVGDGIDSASDIVASVITLIAAFIITKPPNPKYPYGYEKADTLASKVLSFIIFFAGAQLAISSVNRLIDRQVDQVATEGYDASDHGVVNHHLRPQPSSVP